MSDLNLENIVGFKAVDKNGNERQVTVDEMTELVSARIVSAASEISTFGDSKAITNILKKNLMHKKCTE